MSEQARVVIIGGGAVGCSCLYHLAKAGWTDCLLLEQDELTSGSTWHAAGNCPTFAGSWNIIKYQRYSTELYAKLAEMVDYPINYHITGSIRLAHSEHRMDEFRHVASMAEAQGIAYELWTPEGARDRYPFMELHDLKGVLWDPHDGDVDPSQLTQAFAKGARDLGAKVKRFTKVSGLEQLPTGNWLVKTDKGEEINAEIVVNAAGYRAGEVMAMVGQSLPIVSMSHQYLITEPIPELEARSEKLPLLRDPDISYYLREERDGLILGPYEWKATPMWTDGLPADFANQLWEDDLDRIEWYIEQAVERVPLLGSVGVQRVINGPIPYSPEGLPYIGPAHGLKNFYQCCCFSFGIAQAGGAGKTLAEWVTEGEPEWDLWALDPRRYTDYATKTYVTAKAIELYQNEYAIGFPYEERAAGRPARTSPLYDKLAAKGARFGARGGWERAVYFESSDGSVDKHSDSVTEHRADDLTFRRDRNWFKTVGEECRAVRDAVGILDLPGFSKFMVEGPGAEAWLDGLTCSKLPRFGRISLAYMLNEQGGVVSEYTITRVGSDRFHLISAAAGEWHDEDWLRERLPGDGSVRLSCHHGRMGTLVLAGPKSRDVLGQVTGTDLSNEAFSWLTAQPIEIGMARVNAFRVNYVGELGWELHANVEDMVGLYEALWRAGEPHGIRDFGMYAMESLRLDKCYRGWKSDLGTEYSPLMSSLDRFVDFEKEAFIGREALLAEKETGGPKERFVPLTLDEPGVADAPFCAPIRSNGEIVGLVTSGGWSYTLEKSIALGYVRTDLARPGATLEIDILGERRAATVCQEPLYDHNNSRLRA